MFIFATCQVGAEKPLKDELAREHPDFKFAYSRPGFVTFKTPGELSPDFELRSVFARTYGLNLSKHPLEVQPILSAIQDALQKVARASKKNHLHIWERDFHAPSDLPKDYVPYTLESRAIELFKNQTPTAIPLEINRLPSRDDTVFDLVLVENNEAWLGFHTHSENHSAYAGGNPKVTLPEGSPSRAYLKLKEGLLWSQVPLASGDVCVEMGSAPGGASFALIEAGLDVIGIDPAEMDERILKSPQFAHYKRPVAQVLRKELPDSIQWLAMDMNVEPSVSLYAVDRLATKMKDTLLGLLLTIKLNDWKFAKEIPAMIEHVHSMGMVQVRATQLFSNRQEITIHALTELGTRRA